MHQFMRRVFIAGAAIPLFGVLLFAAQAKAQALSASAAATIGNQFTTAYLTTTRLAQEIDGLVGKATPKDTQAGLAAIDQMVAGAERLANQHPNIQPGIRHVRTILPGIQEDGKVSKNAASLVNEVEIELYALMVNASILEAEAHLGNAATALDKKQNQEVIFYLQQAEKALTTASERGAYHIENDIEEVKANLKDMASKLSNKVTVKRADIEIRIQEIHAHLFDVGQEH